MAEDAVRSTFLNAFLNAFRGLERGVVPERCLVAGALRRFTHEK